MQIILVRHAEMAGDPFVCPESPVAGCLSEDNGVAQAERAHVALKDTPITVAFSSPYGRALQTAEIVLRGRGLRVKTLHALREWEPSHAVRELPPDEADALMKRHEDRFAEETWKTEIGEGCFEMYARICPSFLAELAALGIHHRMGGYVVEKGAEAHSIAVFAHGGSLNVLLSFLLGLPPFPVGRFEFALTGVAMLKFSERKGIHYPSLVIPAHHTNGNGHAK
ncbi:histidine phosphatase family protein [bacterium]|nr:histidine phosphatase family protein [bacterium]